MRLTEAARGMAAGSEGIVLGWFTNTGEAVVSFWDGGPMRVPAQLLEPSQPRPRLQL